MSTKRKKQHRDPRPKEVTYIKLYEPDENPWPSNYYMCGMCGHAIAEKDTMRHAQVAHRASSMRLIEVEETEDTEIAGDELRTSDLLSSERGSDLSGNGTGSSGVREADNNDGA